MTEQILLLISLQEIDVKRSHQEEEKKRLPEQLKAVEQVLKTKKEILAQAQARMIQLEKAKRDKELELKVQEENTTKLKERLTKLKTNEEYKANLKEIDTAHEKQGELEEAILVMMDDLDNFKKEVAAAQGDAADAEKQFRVESQNVEAALQRLMADGAVTAAQWRSVAEKVDKNILEDYSKLLTIRKGLAIVALNGNTCTGCHVSLPPQLIAEVKKGGKIFTCNYCHRMLYIPPAPNVG